MTTYGEAAEDAVLNVCNRTVTEMHSLYGDIPAGIIVASLLLVDDISRNLLAIELPIGILMALIGAPFFLYLMMRKGGLR